MTNHAVCHRADAPKLALTTPAKTAGKISTITFLEATLTKAPTASTELLNAAREQAMSIIMRDTFFSQSVLTLTTGVFITGFALKLHAPNAVIGLLVAIPALIQLVQMPAVALVERSACLKKLIIQSTLLSRLLLLPLIAIPFFPSSPWAIATLVAIYMAYGTVAAVQTCVWNTWVKSVLKPDELGGFFSKKLALGSLITLLLTFMGGIFIDGGAKLFAHYHLPVYSVLFLFVIVLGVFGVLPLRKIPEHTSKNMKSAEVLKNQPPLLKRLIEPFRDSNYRNLIQFLSIYDFSINLAIPFLTVHMLNSLHYSMGLVSGLTIISQLANYCLLPLWGRVADRLSNKSVLMICGPLQLLSILAWAVFVLPDATPYTFYFIIAIQLMLGVATAGVSLANGNIAMKLAPHEKSASFMASTGMMASLASGAAPLISGVVSQYFEKAKGLPPILHGNSHWALLFGLSFILGTVALFALKKVDEDGYIGKRRLIKDFLTKTLRLPQRASAV